MSRARGEGPAVLQPLRRLQHDVHVVPRPPRAARVPRGPRRASRWRSTTTARTARPRRAASSTTRCSRPARARSCPSLPHRRAPLARARQRRAPARDAADPRGRRASRRRRERGRPAEAVRGGCGWPATRRGPEPPALPTPAPERWDPTQTSALLLVVPARTAWTRGPQYLWPLLHAAHAARALGSPADLRARVRRRRRQRPARAGARRAASDGAQRHRDRRSSASTRAPGMPAPADPRDAPVADRAVLLRDGRGGAARAADERASSCSATSARPCRSGRGQRHAPIGFIAFDLDYYSSTVEALRVLEGDPERMLPRVLVLLRRHLRATGGPTSWACTRRSTSSTTRTISARSARSTASASSCRRHEFQRAVAREALPRRTCSTTRATRHPRAGSTSAGSRRTGSAPE